MSLRIVSADERLSAANNKTSLAIFGPPGSGKTSLLNQLIVHTLNQSGTELVPILIKVLRLQIEFFKS